MRFEDIPEADKLLTKKVTSGHRVVYCLGQEHGKAFSICDHLAPWKAAKEQRTVLDTWRHYTRDEFAREVDRRVAGGSLSEADRALLMHYIEEETP